MRRIFSLTCVLFLFFFIAGDAFAALSFLPWNGFVLDDRGDQDITNDQFWIADLSLLTNMTYEEQIEGIQGWNVRGSLFFNTQLTPWHMACEAEMQELLSYEANDIMTVFLTSGIGVYTSSTVTWYSGRYDSIIPKYVPPIHELYSIYEMVGEWDLRDNPWPIISTDDTQYPYAGAWVTASYSATAVPIPPSFYLLLSGLVGLAGFRSTLRKT